MAIISKIGLGQDQILRVFPAEISNPSYEFVYRAARGVYWEADLNCFQFKTNDEWSYTENANHLFKAVREEFGLTFELAPKVEWGNLEIEHQVGITSLFGKLYDWAEIEAYIRLDNWNNSVLIATEDYEVFDLIDDLLVELGLGTDWMRRMDDQTPKRYEHCLKEEVSREVIKNALGTIDPGLLKWIWNVNNAPTS